MGLPVTVAFTDKWVRLALPCIAFLGMGASTAVLGCELVDRVPGLGAGTCFLDDFFFYSVPLIA